MITTLMPFDGRHPDVSLAAWIAPGSAIIGDVVLGEDSSIWFNCVVRGDVNGIRIGARTNIQDGSVIHVTTRLHETIIGDDCLIGHLAMVHGCRLHDRAFVGLGSIVMDGCEIESGGMLAAGGMLTPGKRIGCGEMWAGRPARMVRLLLDEEQARHQEGVAGYVALARAYAGESASAKPV